MQQSSFHNIPPRNGWTQPWKTAGRREREVGEFVLPHRLEVPTAWLGQTDSTDERQVRTDDGIMHARCVRRVSETALDRRQLTSSRRNNHRTRDRRRQAVPHLLVLVHQVPVITQGNLYQVETRMKT